MSRWALILRRDGAPVGGRGLARMAAATATGALRLVGSAGFAGDTVSDVTARRLALFSGRLDNREELIRALSPQLKPRSEGDAALALAAFQAWGVSAFERFLGPFALAIYDRRQQRLWLTRDRLGQRLLSYCCDRRRLVAATDDEILLRHPQISQRLDDERITHFLAQREAHGSFFRELSHVEPGEVVTVERDSASRRNLFAVTPEPLLRESAEDLAQRFRFTLEQAVRSRLQPARGEESAAATRSPEPSATATVLLSGGLDSSAITAIAAASKAGDEELVTVSWDLSGTPGDESPFRDDLQQHLLTQGLRTRRREVPCAAAGPLSCGAESWPLWTETPEQSAYRLFHQRVYRCAGGDQPPRGGVLLTGFGGDQLYSGAERWLRDLLRQGRPGDAMAYLGWLASSGKILRPGVARAAASALLPQRVLQWRQRRQQQPPWLSRESAEGLADRELDRDPRDPMHPHRYLDFHRPEQARTLLSPALGRGFALEARQGEQAGLTLRHPFRDLRLVRLSLRLPTDQLFYRGVRRPILRRALAAKLPPSILGRRSKASFESIFRRALAAPAADARRRRLADAGRLDRWICPQWLRSRSRGPWPEGPEALAMWHCLMLDLWLERRDGASAQPSRPPLRRILRR
ncbi:MAG: asparagine synthase-related protein [Acidobacteriota bacterium]